MVYEIYDSTGQKCGYLNLDSLICHIDNISFKLGLYKNNYYKLGATGWITVFNFDECSFYLYPKHIGKSFSLVSHVLAQRENFFTYC